LRRLNFGLTEEDITGKVDTFAFGLVIMYLYKGYHILVKVINNWNTSYDGVDQMMHINLMELVRFLLYLKFWRIYYNILFQTLFVKI
jgi:hypothetical protein